MSESPATNVDQVNVSYVPEEDRIAIRIGLAQNELILWLTRRCLELFWPLLMNRLARTTSVVLQPDELSKAVVLEFEHKQSLEQCDLETAYRRPPDIPVETSVQGVQRRDGSLTGGFVIGQIQTGDSPSSEDAWVVSFLPKSGEGVTLNMPLPFWHSLADMLFKTTEAAQWRLALPMLPRSSEEDKDNQLKGARHNRQLH